MPGNQVIPKSATGLDALPSIASNRPGHAGDDSAPNVRRNVEDRASHYRQQNAKTGRSILLPLVLFFRSILNIDPQADPGNAIVPSAYVPARSSALDRFKQNLLPAGSSPHRGKNQPDHLYKKTYLVYQALRNQQPGKFSLSFLRLVRTDLDMVIAELTPLARSSHWEAVSILDSLCVARNKLAFAAALFDMEEVHPLYRLVLRNKMFLSARQNIQDVLLNWNLLREHVAEAGLTGSPNDKTPPYLTEKQENPGVQPPLTTPPELRGDSADEVSFTAYYPTIATVDTWHKLLVYAHTVSALEKIRKDALWFAKEFRLPRVSTSATPARIVRGTQITVVPSCDGIEFNPEQITLKWLEDFHRTEFHFQADRALEGAAANGQISIFAGPLIIGALKFTLVFNGSENRSILDHEEQAGMYPRGSVFISYSHKDMGIAREINTVLKASGLDVLMDVDSLRSGQVWNDELMRMIECAHIFELLWSSNSSRSEYCRQEWEHALKQDKPVGYIRPVYWQKPMVEPPDELSKFHFSYVDLTLPQVDNR